MKKQLLLILTVLLFSFHLQATESVTKKDFKGDWKFNLPQAPYGYNQGTISIGENNGILTGEIRFSDGTKTKMEDIVFANGIIQCRISTGVT